MTLLLLLAACTFQPGTGFTRLNATSLEAALVPGEARDLGDHAVLTRQSYAVALDRMDLAVGEVVLEALGGGGSTTFDPANPPDGYTLCHGGHCHAEDGSLVSYAEIEAELAGGTATWSAVATLPVGLTLDLLDPVPLDLTEVEPSPELPMADVRRLVVRVEGLALSGEVSGGDLADAFLSFEADLEGAVDLATDLDLPIDRDQAPTLSLAVTVEPDGTLFDDLAFSALAEDGTVTLTTTDEAGATVLAAVAATLPHVTVTPGDSP